MSIERLVYSVVQYLGFCFAQRAIREARENERRIKAATAHVLKKGGQHKVEEAVKQGDHQLALEGLKEVDQAQEVLSGEISIARALLGRDVDTNGD